MQYSKMARNAAPPTAIPIIAPIDRGDDDSGGAEGLRVGASVGAWVGCVGNSGNGKGLATVSNPGIDWRMFTYTSLVGRYPYGNEASSDAEYD
jgi:hypothetical protein